MYASRRKSGFGRRDETQLLGRLISVLKGCYVSIDLLNGCCLVGCVVSYEREVRTVNLVDSLNDLQLTESSGIRPELPSSLRDVYENFKSRSLSSGQARRITKTPPSFVILEDVIVSFGDRRFRASKVEVHERWMATVTPFQLPSAPASTGTKTSKSAPSANQLRHMILQEPCDKIKNAAFLRCSRIGQNSLK